MAKHEWKIEVGSGKTSRKFTITVTLDDWGALCLQQCACILPTTEGANAELRPVTAKIVELGGDFLLIELPIVPPR